MIPVRNMLFAALLPMALSFTAEAHIALLHPTALMDGYAERGRVLKVAPFGAPGVDVVAAPAVAAKAVETIRIDLDVYVYHPGEIVVLWTRDPEARDLPIASHIATPETEVPHANLLTRQTTPCHPEDGCVVQRKSIPFSFDVTLPDVEGVIYLVVRQVMSDKYDVEDDGRISLARAYYHSASKLELGK